MVATRSSGILLHPTSLPGSFGIGDLGQSAYKWIDFLHKSNQTLWQVLPLGPTGYGNSPYASLSAFAGNPMLISIESLVEDGYLSKSVLTGDAHQVFDRTNYDFASSKKVPLLNEAAQDFLKNATAEPKKTYQQFCNKNRFWLDDFAFYTAVKDQFELKAWNNWDKDIALREPKAVEAWKLKCKDEIEIQKALQFFFYTQWKRLKLYANEKWIRIIGDIPVFVAGDSADVWTNRHLFHLDEKGQPTLIAGVPPDYFSETGQRWGNPLYKWDIMHDNGYEWWIKRVSVLLELVDIIRIDHFRGFAAYWEIPASEPTAVKGRWVTGPGTAIFEAINKALGKLPILAEDLGVITPDVIELRDRFSFPGMKILQFAFDEAALRASFGDFVRNPFLPHNYPQTCAVYTGTHDNDTAAGWFTSCNDADREKVLGYLNCCGKAFHWVLIRSAMASVSNFALFPMQDVLGLGSDARMNIPGTSESNWEWRMKATDLRDEDAQQLLGYSKVYERNLSE